MQHRGTIHLEESRVVEVRGYPGEQFVIRLQSPRSADNATPGSFVHAQCETAIPMRRPLSIMRANPGEGWIEVLFKVVGDGLRALSEKKPGDLVSIIGPIGTGFRPSKERPNMLLIGGGVGIPPLVFLAETLMAGHDDWRPFGIMGSEIPFPFELVRSKFDFPGASAKVFNTVALLENWQIPARLTSLQGYEGCYNGYATDLARHWLRAVTPDALASTEIFSCGPTVMLRAVAALASEFNVPCQVSLEEFMACAVGGCAGCTVSVQTEHGSSMKRVCVDGPVFEAKSIFGG